ETDGDPRARERDEKEPPGQEPFAAKNGGRHYGNAGADRDKRGPRIRLAKTRTPAAGALREHAEWGATFQQCLGRPESSEVGLEAPDRQGAVGTDDQSAQAVEQLLFGHENHPTVSSRAHDGRIGGADVVGGENKGA